MLTLNKVIKNASALKPLLLKSRNYAATATQANDGIQQGVAYSHLLKREPTEAFRSPELAHMSANNSKYASQVRSHYTNSMIGETKKMNLFQAVNDAMSIALTTDEKAGKLYLFL